MKRNRFTEELSRGLEGALRPGFGGRSVPEARRQRRPRLLERAPVGCEREARTPQGQVEADKAMTEHQRAQTAFHEELERYQRYVFCLAKGVKASIALKRQTILHRAFIFPRSTVPISFVLD